MILVIVGFHYQPFDRLIKKMDEIAGEIEEEVVMQIGHSKYKPKNAKYFQFVDDDKEIHDLIERSRVVVAHAGAGTILDVLSHTKPLVLIPRLHKFNEHVDDQQLELSGLMAKQKRAVVIDDIEKLKEAVMKEDPGTVTSNSGANKLTAFLKGYIGGSSK